MDCVSWLDFGGRVVTKYEMGQRDIALLITTNVFTKRSIRCGFKTFQNCYTHTCITPLI